ncbi:hypothetical protein GY45DRAFT_79419 [Cubamyces sp. BRFM 1775]|nr:hypothetical protein GY45DRAFT_79419 [Cubamyces sp. BRFM 1775]
MAARYSASLRTPPLAFLTSLSVIAARILLKTVGLTVSTVFSPRPFASSFFPMYYSSYLASRIASSAGACARVASVVTRTTSCNTRR